MILGISQSIYSRYYKVWIGCWIKLNTVVHKVSDNNKIELVSFDFKYLTIHISYFIYQQPIINHRSISNQSTHRIINILSNHWIRLSTHPNIYQLIPSYHPIFQSINPSNQSIQWMYPINLSNQSIHPIVNNLSNLGPNYRPIISPYSNYRNHWSIKSYVSDYWLLQYWLSNNWFRVSHNPYIPGIIIKFESAVESNITQFYIRWAMITKLNQLHLIPSISQSVYLILYTYMKFSIIILYPINQPIESSISYPFIGSKYPTIQYSVNWFVHITLYSYQ